MSVSQTDVNQQQPGTSYGYDQQPGQAPGPQPAYTQQPMYAQPIAYAQPIMMSPRSAHMMTFAGNLIIGIGVIILAFSLSTITVYFPSTYTQGSSTVSMGAIVMTIGVLVIGIGAILRSIGVYVVSKF